MSKKKHVMRRRMRKPRKLKISHYAARMFELNEYLDICTDSKPSEKIREI